MLVLKKGGKKPLSIKIEMTFLLVNLEFDSVSQDEGRCKKIQQQRNILEQQFWNRQQTRRRGDPKKSRKHTKAIFPK